jgi:uncharacterized protein (DUF488 family)
MTFDVYTIGFSNRTWEQTLEILATYKIQRLVDIRTLPGSKYTPQFNQDQLKKALPESGIDYIHMKSLGGLRKPRKNSTTNAAWRNDSFRGYADYMQTAEFENAVNELVALFADRRTVYACTEAVFWRCHRQLLSDSLTLRGYRVGHIFSSSKIEEHKLTDFMRADGTKVTYPSLI